MFSIDSKELCLLGWLAYNFVFNLCKINSQRWVVEYLLEKFAESFIGRLKIKYVEGFGKGSGPSYDEWVREIAF